VRLSFVVVLAVGCGPVESAPPAHPVVAPASASSTGAVPAAESAGVVNIEPFVAAASTVSIVEPRPDESMPAPEASSHKVVLDDGGYLDENPGSRITLVLDGDMVRDVADVRAAPALGGLAFDGRELTLGEHTLAAVLVGPRGDAARFGPARTVAVAVRRFFVGPPQASPTRPPEPMLVCLVPRGTYNGVARARSALLDFAVIGGDVGRGLVIRVRVSGPKGSGEATLGAPGPYALRGLDSGDYRFDLTLFRDAKPVDGPWGHASRTITVNLDGPSR
jgi:hypothetical protein